MIKLFFYSFLLFFSTQLVADSSLPWGGAKVTPTEYLPQKVVYDVHVDSIADVESVLDRASHLSKITGANPFDQSIVLVLHGYEINYFAIKNLSKYEDLMKRAQSLVEGEVLKVRMCKIAAESKGFQPGDIHGFVEMVPMGDAEIIRLQYEEGYAYMQ